MIENLTKEEITQLIDELREHGYEIQRSMKEALVQEECKKLNMGNAFVTTCIKKSIYTIADWATDNYTRHETRNGTPRTHANKFVPCEKEAEYRKIISGILEVIKPYYGRLGFEERGH